MSKWLYLEPIATRLASVPLLVPLRLRILGPYKGKSFETLVKENILSGLILILIATGIQLLLLHLLFLLFSYAKRKGHREPDLSAIRWTAWLG